MSVDDGTVAEAIASVHLTYATSMSRVCNQEPEVILPIVKLVASKLGEPTWMRDDEVTPEDGMLEPGAPLTGEESLAHGSPVWHRTGDFVGLTGKLVNRYGIDAAYQIIDREDLERLEERERLVRALKESEHFLTLEEMADRMQAFEEFLRRNRAASIATGYPAEAFLAWPAPLLVNTYPVRFPQNLFASTTARTPALQAGSFVAERPALYWCRPLSNAITTIHERCPRGMVECTYERARLNEPVTQEDARRIEEGREALQDLKISLVNRLAVALQRGSAFGLWNDCLQLITGSLLGSDADFYLEFDRLSGQWLASTGLVSTHNVVELNPGGLTEIFELIGYCEKELTIGTMDQVKTRLQPLVASTGSIDYLAILQSARRQKVDVALEAFMQFRYEEATFWREFHDRVNSALRDEFYEQVVTRTRVRRADAARFEPHLKFFAEWSRNALEQTGTLPDLPLLPVPESNYRFKREGKLWKLAFKGQEVHVKDRIGLQYLQYLLKRPGQEISVQNLVNAIQGNPVSRLKVSSAQDPIIFEEIGSTPGKAEDLGPLVDKKAKEQIQAKIRELGEEIEEANARGDDRRANACEREKDELFKYLSAAFGLGGRPRQVGSTTERARTAVRNAMVHALKDIKEVHPQLHEHLRSVSTGSFCRYDPPGGESPPWEF